MRKYLRNLFRRHSRLAPIAGGPLAAAILMRELQKNPRSPVEVEYRNRKLHFRRIDEPALNEVLFEDQYGFLRQRLSALPAPYILDVGANIGMFSVWVSLISPNAHVLAVEAGKDAANLAAHNLAALSRAGGSWTVIHRAAASVSDQDLYFQSFGDSLGGKIAAGAGDHVRSVSLMDLVDSHSGPSGRVDILKVDIEGSEESFLAQSALALQRVDACVVELHPDHCDVIRVERTLSSVYGTVQNVLAHDKTSKPLLYCY